ncbi:MAG: hypothetical protein AMJ78_05230 [Omnitrophica WOR_2 bacterium SM23_29]|nr:MAG: hypothetical protein AMJ78_05230 [Omnitrophica WOR_2 bacterium SM23_29]
MTSAELSKAAQPSRTKTVQPKKEIATASESEREEIKIVKKSTPERKPSIEIKQPSIQKLEGITSVDLKELRFVPSSYAQAVRGKIRENLTPAKSGVEGNVFVRFVIASDGKLQELNIIDEKSTRDGLLREVVFEAIKDSSPFPKFPKDITTPKVTFTCQISFENK